MYNQISAFVAWLFRANGTKANDRMRLCAAVDWLLHSQEVSGGTGYAHSFHLLRGWQAPYPETTGYIIPSLLKTANLLQDVSLKDSACRALKWLTTIQSPEGFFPDLHGNPQVFDTGQILIGLNYVFEHNPDMAPVQGNIDRAAEWLASIQSVDGSFSRYAYNDRPHSYYSRVGAALIKSGQLLKNDRIIRAGTKNIEWTIAQQDNNGFFNHLSFADHPPYLHTMIYVIEGLLDAADYSGQTQWNDCAKRFTDRLLETKNEKDLLRSQYHRDFRIANTEICVTGLAQWAGVCLRIAGLTGSGDYQREGLQSLDYVCARQVFSHSPALHGALSGSIPIWGEYMRLAFPNWGVKFFIDGLLEKQRFLEQ